MTNTYKIKKLEACDLQDALHLVWETFLAFEAPEYSDEGVQEFRNFIELPAIMDMQARSALLLWGCFDDDRIAGVIASRPPCHISLLFTDKEYHRRGIARALHHTVLEHYKMNSDYKVMTVNSSPYAVEVYHRLGFVDMDVEQLKNGIRFTPMQYKFR